MAGNSQIFYIADTHFSHRGMQKLRPEFSSVEEMNRRLLEDWNSRVRAIDTVYILGDLFAYSADEHILSRLRGEKILLCGNHEAAWLHKVAQPERYFRAVYPEEEPLTIRDGARTVVMSHKPRPELYREEEKTFFLYGHLHLSPPKRADWQALLARERVLNVGADLAKFAHESYAPAALDEWVFFNLVWKIEGKNGKPTNC